jgi:hypothetical protein
MFRSTVVGLGLLGLTGVVFAQSAPVASETQAALERATTVTSAEMSANAPRFVEEIASIASSLQKLDVSAASKANIGESTPCVAQAASSSTALQAVSQAAFTSFSAAMADGAVDRASFEYRKMAIALTKSRELLSQAEACASLLGSRGGSSKTKLTGAPAASADDMKALPDDMMEWAFDPPDASPF